MEKELSYLIDEVLKLDSFWNVNYYLRSMKKAPHSGIEYVTIPDFYLKYRITGLWALFTRSNGTVLAFLQELVEDKVYGFTLLESRKQDFERYISGYSSRNNKI